MQRAIVSVSVCVGVIHTALLVLFLRERTGFLGDDLVLFWLSETRPLSRYLFETGDVHLAPLHRAASLGVYRVAPMQFDLGLSVMLAFHALGVWFLYRTLELIRRTPLNAILVLLYASHVYLGVLLLWWSSGMHRLPYVALSLIAIFYFLRYRETKAVRHAALVFVAFLCALGFYTKAFLIPLYLLALELCLPRVGRRRLRDFRLPLALLAASITCLLVWRMRLDDHVSIFNWSPTFHALFQWLSWTYLLESTSGMPGGPGSPGQLLSVGAWSALITWTVVRAPSSTKIWVVLGGLVAVNIGTLAVSNRSVIFGHWVSAASRYYFELAFLVVLFGSLAIGRVVEARGKRPCQWGRRALVAASVLVPLYVIASHATCRHMVETHYSYHAKATRYLDNLRRSFAELDALGDESATLVDGRTPMYVSGWHTAFGKVSVLARVVGATPKFAKNAALRIDDEGRLVANLTPRVAPRARAESNHQRSVRARAPRRW